MTETDEIAVYHSGALDNDTFLKALDGIFNAAFMQGILNVSLDIGDSIKLVRSNCNTDHIPCIYKFLFPREAVPNYLVDIEEYSLYKKEKNILIFNFPTFHLKRIV
jgi:hypothetical protein